MNTIQWQTTSFDFEIEKDDFEHRNTPETKSSMSAEREESQAIQKRKYEDPSTNENRKAHIALIEKFGALIIDNKLEEIVQDLLADDIEIFIFNSARKSVQYANRVNEFVNLYKDIEIQERIARETDFDEEKQTVCQICTYKTIYKDEEGSLVDEVACELFTIKDGRISKYRVSFGRASFDINQFKAPLEPTRKEKMLAKGKEINYALAGQPDFEKVASLLDENVEYKLCGLDAFKSEMLFQSNFAWSFKKMFENITLLSIVPYELYTNEQENFVTGTYVYNMQNKISGKNSVWLSTCVYGFSQNISITKVIHQGEIYEEDEIEIPFEVFTRSKIEERLREYYNFSESIVDRFYSDDILYDCTLWSLCSAIPIPGYFQGLKDIKDLLKAASICEALNPEFVKIIDIYVDHHNKSHDVAYALLCSQGPSFSGGKPNPGEIVNCIGFIRIAYENGKMAKMFEIMIELKEKIPTPFEDKDFNFINRK